MGFLTRNMSRDEYTERFAFNVEWYDASAMLVRKYQLFYYPKEKLIEMFDLKNRRTFLKKCEYPSIQLSDLYIGATVSIYSRQLKVNEFGDEYTISKLGTKRQKTIAIIKPDGYAHLGKIIDAAHSIGLIVGEMRMLKMTREQAEEFYNDQRGQSTFSRIVQFLSSDAVTAIEFVGENSVEKWKSLMGPDSPSEWGNAQNTIRGQFGTDKKRCAQTAVFDNCTLCIVKPHVFQQGAAG